VQHPEGVFDRFVVRANDSDPLPAYSNPVAVLAKKHAMPKAFLTREFPRQMKDSRGEEQPFRSVRLLFAL